MVSIRRLSLALLVVAAVGGEPCRAQYYYPPGYAGYGWNGWGGGGSGGSTVQGDVARGMGMFAAGAGVYNEKSAVAASINTDTAMRWNQYMWQSQQEANRRYHEKLGREQAGNVRGREEVLPQAAGQPRARRHHPWRRAERRPGRGVQPQGLLPHAERSAGQGARHFDPGDPLPVRVGRDHDQRRPVGQGGPAPVAEDRGVRRRSRRAEAARRRAPQAERGAGQVRPRHHAEGAGRDPRDAREGRGDDPQGNPPAHRGREVPQGAVRPDPDARDNRDQCPPVRGREAPRHDPRRPAVVHERGSTSASAPRARRARSRSTSSSTPSL